MSTVVLVPWLPLDEQLTFGPYNFTPLEELATRVQPDTAEMLRAIGQTFVGAAGPNLSSVMWPADEGECPTFKPPDLDEYNVAIRLLALGVLIENQFFSYFTPATALNFELVVQRFEPGAESFAIETRRRDGDALSGGHRFDKSRFTRPVAAPSNPRMVFDGPLLTSLAGCLEIEDPLSSRIAQSAVPYLLANRMDGSSSFQSDLFWLATAIEQLLEVSDRTKGATITETFSKRLADHLAATGFRCERTMVTTWARELYGRRSDVHGRPHLNQRWDTGWHAFLASHAFGLLVKRMLAADERYVLSDADEIALEAFPHRAGRMRIRRLKSAASVWGETATAAGWALARQQTTAWLRDAEGKGAS